MTKRFVFYDIFCMLTFTISILCFVWLRLIFVIIRRSCKICGMKLNRDETSHITRIIDAYKTFFILTSWMCLFKFIIYALSFHQIVNRIYAKALSNPKKPCSVSLLTNLIARREHCKICYIPLDIYLVWMLMHLSTKFYFL